MENFGHNHNDWNEHFANETVSGQLALTEKEEPLHLFLKYLRKDGLILDLGCGLGKHLLFWHNKGYKIAGIDLEYKCIQTILDYDSSVDARVGNILHLPYNNESAEFAISYGVVEHFEDGPQEALNEMCRVLKKDGIAFISVPYNNPLYRARHKLTSNKLLRLLFCKENKSEIKPFVEKIFTRFEFKECLVGAGFEVIESMPVLTKWGLCSAFRMLRGRNFPLTLTYRTVIDPPLNSIGRLSYAIIMKINPWVIGHFQFYVARKK